MKDLTLTSEEGFVLSRIDGRLTLEDIGDLTGIEPTKVERIVGNLANMGAIAIVKERPRSWPPNAPSEDVLEALAFAHSVPDEPPTQKMLPTLDGPPEPWEEPKTSVELSPVEAAPEALRPSQAPEAEEAADAEPGPDPDEAVQTAAEAEEDRAAGVLEPANYRKMFETMFHHKDPTERVALALVASSQELYAFAFDPEPQVVAAILGNDMVGPGHGRFIAAWHPTSAGLEHLGKKHRYLTDPGIQRKLLRNQHTSESLLKRFVQPKRMGEIYGAAVDRDVPLLTRTRVRGILRAKFTQAPPEERVELIVKTEGRCLPLLIGCTFDGRTTQSLASRQYTSTLFIQNLAKFPGTPPMLLAHLIKQPSARRNQAVKRLLLQHKNMPAEAKRQA